MWKPAISDILYSLVREILFVSGKSHEISKSGVCGNHGNISVAVFLGIKNISVERKCMSFPSGQIDMPVRSVCPQSVVPLQWCVPNLAMKTDSIWFPCSWGWGAVWHRVWNGWNQWWLLWHRPRSGNWRKRHSQLRCTGRSKFCDRWHACTGSLESKTGKLMYFMHPLLALNYFSPWYLWRGNRVLFTFLLQFVS